MNQLQPDGLIVMPTEVQRKVKFPRGTYSKIARIHRVSPQFVRMVALGLKRSARIEATVEKYRAKHSEAA